MANVAYNMNRCDSDRQGPVLAELTPVMLYDNTVVKVPYTTDTGQNVQRSAQCSDVLSHSPAADYCFSANSDSMDSFRCESGRVLESCDDSGDASLMYMGTDHDSTIEGRVTRLSNLYRTFPKDMFVNRMITTYSSSEAKIEDIRLELFEYLKALEDFPYGSQVELKKRIHTRSGESVVIKLCRDIHVILSVIDGAEFSDLTDVISLPRPTKSRNSQAVSRNCSPSDCACSAEIQSMKDIVAQLRADILMLKQKHTITEIQGEQFKDIDRTVMSMMSDIKQMNDVISTRTNCIEAMIRNVIDERSLGPVNIRNDIDVLFRKLNSLELNFHSVLTENVNILSNHKGSRSNTESDHVISDCLCVATTACPVPVVSSRLRVNHAASEGATGLGVASAASGANQHVSHDPMGYRRSNDETVPKQTANVYNNVGPIVDVGTGSVVDVGSTSTPITHIECTQMSVRSKVNCEFGVGSVHTSTTHPANSQCVRDMSNVTNNSCVNQCSNHGTRDDLTIPADPQLCNTVGLSTSVMDV